MKKTALYQKHLDLGGKMVEYAGYQLPVQYPAGVMAEHHAVRTAAGLFDVSHMGEIRLTHGALACLQHLLANDMADMPIGSCRYSPMCNAQGGVVDDLIVYRTGEDEYLAVVNAANREKDFAHMQANNPTGAVLEDVSDSICEIALQGPKAAEIAAQVSALLPQLKYYTFTEATVLDGRKCLISRTGYTGEDGFEFYCDPETAPLLWDRLLELGAPLGIQPCGLGARDTLRLEAGMPLYGHEMTDEITPVQTGLGRFVKLDKPGFVGRDALLAAGQPRLRKTGLRVTGRGIAREGAEVYDGGEKVGWVTSGTQLPHLGWPGAMAMIDVEHREKGRALQVDIRGRRVDAEVVGLPFYRREQ